MFDTDGFTPIARLVGDESYSIITDHLGTPNLMFNSEGKKVWQAELDIYGKVRSSYGGRSFCPFRYPGQYEDGETGLYYNRFRYYDPEDGVYVSQDPIGLKSGILNSHAYVHDLNSWIDPLGLQCTHSASNPKQAHAAIKDKWGHNMSSKEMKEVHETINRIKTRNPLFPNKDGSAFQNSSLMSPNSQRLNTGSTYQEWTVKTPGVGNRGTRRIVVDNKTGQAFYSHDHYDSFIELDLSGWK